MPESFTVPEKAARADRWLASELGWSRSRVKALFDGGLVRVEGATIRGKDSLNAGTEVLVTIPEEKPPAPLRQEDIAVDVLFVDDHVVVVDKPATLVVHPSKGHDTGTLLHALFDLIEPEAGEPDRPGVVHRLDLGTSGVMVIARTAAALTTLSGQFREHTVGRSYLAVVHGQVRDLNGTIDAPLGRHPVDRKRFAIKEGGRRAVTHYQRLAVCKGFSLVRCRLETGRTHQIRVHMTSLGHPLAGDPLYRTSHSRPMPGVSRQLLHAHQLAFDHPHHGERLAFSVPPPADFAQTMEQLGLVAPIS